ncbi:ribosome-binding protein 1 [Drosophila sechellia]|uniref:ribosome-binding protein 1 n=1 Tax=Drosophila sechellia TaxID=7238 RepID=UPI0013DE3AA7|nr:ribosome-binding protein 1 [Drosophila sechellia]
MFKPHYHLAAVLLCFVFTTAQVVPNAEIGRITIQVPLLSNGKPVILTNQEREEVATVEEIKPGKVHVVQEVVVPPTVKSDNKVRVTRSVSDSGIPNHGIPNPGIPNHGIPNRGIPNDGIPNPGIPNHGIPNPGIPNHGIPNRGIPNDGIPNPGIPNHGIPNPGIPNHGIPNPGIPNHGIPNAGIPIPDASEHKPVVVMPSSRTTSAPASTSMPKRVPTRNCFHLLMGGITTTSPVDMMTPPSTENCDELCTKFEYSPICAFNGICIHEFANQCVMNTFNCKHRDLSFRAVDEDVCRLGVCMRRCKAEELAL